jgi:hypothetical protein
MTGSDGGWWGLGTRIGVRRAAALILSDMIEYSSLVVIFSSYLMKP